MRTTVELPPDLLRAAKARAAERGEALKVLFTRAVAQELDRSAPSTGAEPAAWPLIRSRRTGQTRLTGADLAEIDAAGDVASVRRPRRRRR